MVWQLQKGIIHVVERVIENVEFTLGVRRMKAACVVSGMEGGNQEV